MSKKILYAATVYTHLAKFHKPFLEDLIEKGYELYALANSNEGRKQEIEELGVRCWDIPFSRKPLSSKNLIAIKELNQLFKNNYFDLIHVDTPIASFLVRAIAKRYSQGKILYTAHGFHFYKGAPLLNWLLYYPLEKISSRFTDGLIVMNDEDFKNGRKKLGFTPERNLFFIHGVGVDISKYNYDPNDYNIKEELKLSQTDIVITCNAEFTENKNHYFLIEAFEKISLKYPNVYLLLLGYGEKKEEVYKFVSEKGIKNIIFLGYRTDVPSILNSTDILTLVSNREGLPKSLMEGMANAKPLVVTNVRGSRDLVEHDKNGYVVPLGNSEGLTKYLNNLIIDFELRKKMGEESRRLIRLYDINNVKKELNIIYKLYL